MQKSPQLKQPTSKAQTKLSPVPKKAKNTSATKKATKHSLVEKTSKQDQTVANEQEKSSLKPPKTASSKSSSATGSKKTLTRSRDVSPNKDSSQIKSSTLKKTSGTNSSSKDFAYIKASPSDAKRSNTAKNDSALKPVVREQLRSSQNATKTDSSRVSGTETLPKNVKFSETSSTKPHKIVKPASADKSSLTSSSASESMQSIPKKDNQQPFNQTKDTGYVQEAVSKPKTTINQTKDTNQVQAVASTPNTNKHESTNDVSQKDTNLQNNNKESDSKKRTNSEVDSVTGTSSEHKFERQTSGHLVSVENVGRSENHYRNIFVGIARSMAYLQIASREQQAKKDKENTESEKDEDANDSDDSTTEKSSKTLKKPKPTLLALANSYRQLNSVKYEQKQKMFNYHAMDYEDPFLTAYYNYQEEENKKELARKKLEKQERPLVFVEITFNHAWQKQDENQEQQKKSSKNHTSQQKNGQTKTDDKTKPKQKKLSNKNKKLTYKSLDADGYTIFDYEEGSIFGDKSTEGNEEARGTKSEMLIRIKKGLYLNNWLEKNGIDDCQLGYVKCYLYAKPALLQKPRKHRSNNCYISKTGNTYWDHVFILRGFSINELKQLYVVINVKGKYRERFQDLMDADDEPPSTPHDILAQKRDQLVHAIKRRNISLGEFILAGEEAKIYPFTAGALMFRDTVKEEIEAWREACANPGTTQMVERHLLPRDEELSPLTPISPNPTSNKQSKQKWQSVLGKVSSRPKKTSPSNSISS